MSDRLQVFPEPTSGNDLPLGYAEPMVRWYRNNNGAAATRARSVVNDMYEKSPARRDSAFRGRLRSVDDNTHYSAIDELLVGSLLSGEERVEYEPRETGTDFAVYRNSSLYCAIECVTLLPSSQYSTVEATRASVVDILNSRLSVTTHSVTVNSVIGTGNLPVRRLVEEVDRLVSGLNLESGSADLVAKAGSYELAMTLHPLPVGSASDGGRIAELGVIPDSQTVAEEANSKFTPNDRRLAISLNGKADRKYTEHGAPYAIFVGLRQDFADIHDLENAVYGTRGFDPVRQRWVRANDGLFGRRGDEWKSVRVGAVFAAIDWEPYRTSTAEIVRLNNPTPLQEFPRDVVPIVREVRWNAVGEAMEWVESK